jgi:hypothetical protein
MVNHNARSEEESALLAALPWRQGRTVGPNVYAQTSDDPADSDVLIGQFHSEMLAWEAVTAHNRDQQDLARLLEDYSRTIGLLNDVIAAKARWRRVADVLAQELRRWGWGDFHYGPQNPSQEQRVLDVLAIYEQAVAETDGAQ